MLIPVIKFEIVDFKAGMVEEFFIENTIENQEKVFTNRYTRNITFDQAFDFEFIKKQHFPSEFIHFSTELENELCEVDEMTGVFA